MSDTTTHNLKSGVDDEVVSRIKVPGSSITPGTLVTMPGYQMRAVCITVWPGPKECLYDVTVLPEPLQYLCVGGEETCPETGSKHRHFYAYAKNRGLTLNGWKRIFGKHCHVEQARGTHEQAIAYCGKDAGSLSLGEQPMENGHRKGFDAALQLVKSGERPMKVARTAESETVKPIAQYTKFFDRLYEEVTWERMCEEGFKVKQVFILNGSTGKGKTRSVFEEHGLSDVYKCVTNDAKWFDGYTGQRVVLFDECSPSNIMPVTHFLTLTDGYPLRVPIKGGFTCFNPEIIYFTSNIDWPSWWPTMIDEHRAACQRRITEVRVFKDDGQIVFE